MYCEALVLRVKAGPFRNCPAFQGPIEFQTKIIETGRSMLLNDKLQLRGGGGGLGCATRLGGLFEVAFLPVLVKAHTSVHGKTRCSRGACLLVYSVSHCKKGEHHLCPMSFRHFFDEDTGPVSSIHASTAMATGPLPVHCASKAPSHR